VVQDDAALE
jgi:hypothetical protein